MSQPGSEPFPVGISLAAPFDRVRTFSVRGAEGVALLSVGIDLHVPDVSRFDADLTTVQLGSIAIDSLTATPYTAIRTARHVAASDVEFVHFGLVRLGRGTLDQDGRRLIQRAGVAGLARSAAPYRSQLSPPTRATRSQIVHTTVPLSHFPGRQSTIDALTAAALPATALVAATTSFLGTVSLGLPEPGTAAATFVEHAVVDLLLAVVAERMAELLPAESVEAGTRVRIRDFVLRHLADVELRPQRIAAEFGISIRYLHRLFESEDTSVAAFIRGERLKKAAGELTDTALRHLDLKAIARRSGFGGPDQFSRAFKSRYGMSPREYRRGDGLQST